MAHYDKIVKKNLSPYLESLKDDYIARKDKTFFWPSGTQVYCGKQGTGKTISAVFHVMRLKLRYPHMVLVSNLVINGLTPRTFSTKGELRQIMNTAREGVADSEAPIGTTGLLSQFSDFDPRTEYIFFKSKPQLEYALVEVNNGFKGVVYLIDEIHTYFNALESKNIPMYIFTEISQQRKQRKCIIGTSQLFKRMALPFREQCDNMILCSTHFGILTLQRVYEGDYKTDFDDNIISKSKRMGFFFHNRKIRGYFDTYQKVISGSDQYKETNKVESRPESTKGKKMFQKNKNNDSR